MPNDKKLFERSEFFLSVVGHSVDFLNFQKESWSTEFIEVWFFAVNLSSFSGSEKNIKKNILNLIILSNSVSNY